MSDERLATRNVDERPWHQKSPYAGVKHDPHELSVWNGKIREGVNYTFTREAWDEFHAGRRCGECHDAQIAEAWPRRCVTCHADFKFAYDRLLRRYQGEEHVGSTVNWRDELDRLDGELEEDNWKANPTSGIVLPKGVTV